MNAPCICPACGQKIERAPLNFDAVSGLIVVGDCAVQLTQREADYFACFSAKWPNITTRGFLMDWVYGDEPGDEPGEKNIDVYVHKLRRKIRPAGLDIENVTGHGFRLVYPEAA